MSKEKTLQTLREFEQIAEEKCRDWHRQIELYRREYFMEVTGDTTETDEPVYLTDITDAVDRARHVLINAGWKVYVDRPGEDIPDQRMAGVVSDFLKKLYSVLERRQGYQFLSPMVDKMLMLGMSVAFVQYDPTVRKLPYSRNATFLQNPPIRIHIVEPDCVYPVFGGPDGGLKYIIHKEVWSPMQALQFAQALDAATGSDEATNAIIEKYEHMLRSVDRYKPHDTLVNYWGWHYLRTPENPDGAWYVLNAVRYGDVLLRPFTPMPAYQRIPWVMGACHDTRHEEYVKRFQPFTMTARRHQRDAERLQGQIFTLLEKIVSMPFVIETTPQFPNPPEIVADDDFVITLQPGQKWQAPQFARIPPDLYQGLALVRERLQKALLPDSMWGIPTSQASGYSFEQMQEGGRMRLHDPRISLQGMMEQIFDIIMGLLNYYHANDVLYATSISNNKRYTLRGADLVGWDIQVEWSAELPGDELRNVAMATQTVGANLLPRSTALQRYLGVEDPQTEIDKIVLENVVTSHPQLAELKAYEVMRDMRALPDPSAAIQPILQEAAKKYHTHRQLAIAAGLPPEQAEMQAQQYVQDFLRGAYMALNARVSPLQAFGQPPIQDQGGPNDRGTPSRQGERNVNNPETGSLPIQREGRQPPGNPADPAMTARRIVQQMRGEEAQ